MSGKQNRKTKKAAKLIKNKGNQHILKTIAPVLSNGKEVVKRRRGLALFNKKWKSIAGIITLITFCILIYNQFIKSDRQKFEDNNIISGKVKSPKISEYSLLEEPPNFNFDAKSYSFPIIKGIHIKDLKKILLLPIQLGGHVIITPTIDLYQGINIFNPLYSGCTGNDLLLAAKNDRLYVSAKFIDFQTENEIGEMEFNHWKIYNNTYLDYHEDNDNFEVIDKQGNIVFSISFIASRNKSMPFLYISGYFVSPKSVLVLNNRELFSPGRKYVNDHNHECIQKSDSNWRQSALIEISKIKSTFK